MSLESEEKHLTYEKWGRYAKAFCEPLYLSSPFLMGGHDKDVANGTITYIKFQDHLYGVTCAHVFFDQIAQGKWLTVFRRSMINRFGADTEEGFQSNFRSLRAHAEDRSKPDIAIARLGRSFYELLMVPNNMTPIDLDEWAAPDYSRIEKAIGFGYPTEHKENVSSYVVAYQAWVECEVASNLTPGREDFMLAGESENPHGVFFSGMSGGPVFHYDSTNHIGGSFLGIIYEGAPGSSLDWHMRDKEESFLNDHSINIWVQTITPSIFQSWLTALKFI